jgi:hypothetical protein
LVGSSSSSTSGAPSSSFASSTRIRQPPENEASGRSELVGGEAEPREHALDARRALESARELERRALAVVALRELFGRLGARARRTAAISRSSRAISRSSASMWLVASDASSRTLRGVAGSISWRRRPTRTPRPHTTRPSSASSSPAAIRSRVVLPAPLRPIRPTRSPGATCRSTPRNSTRAPKLRETPSSRISMRGR